MKNNIPFTFIVKYKYMNMYYIKMINYAFVYAPKYLNNYNTPL